MFRVIFCLLAAVIGGFAVFYGSESVIGYKWDNDAEEFRYADPPVIQVKNNLKINHSNTTVPLLKTEEIVCFTYEDFKKRTVDLDTETFDYDIRESSSLGNKVVLYAKAENKRYLITYEPSLLIAISGYGSDDLISEIEIEDDTSFLRIIDPFEEYSVFLAETFRKKRLPYALNIKGLNSKDIARANKEVFFPKYMLETNNSAIEFPVSLSYEEVQLKMKGLIYDAVIKSYDTGYQIITFKATIKNLKCLQTTLGEMLPLPVKLVSFPFWSESL